MEENKPRLYFDSCCFIDVAKYELGSVQEERQREVWYSQKLLQASRDGMIESFTAMLTVAECQHVEGYINDEIKRLFKSILTSGRIVKLIQDNIFIAERARDLFWEYQIKLQGADALHVASALEMTCLEFITLDEKGPYKKAQEIEALGMKIIRPSQTNLLPPSYRQQKIPIIGR